MVETVLDPIRMPTVALSQAEMDAIEEQMAAGALPPDFLDRYHAAVAKNVFGSDHKTDKDGEPIEQGIGSAGNQTKNSINAYKRYGKYEDDFTPEQHAANLKRMQAELDASTDARAALGAARRKRGRK